MENKDFTAKFVDVEKFSEDKVLVQSKYDNINNEFNSNYEEHVT